MDIDKQIDHLIDRMFIKYYSGDELYNWRRITFFGGGNIENYKKQIRKLINEDKRVKTGYKTSKRIRGSKTYYIFYK